MRDRQPRRRIGGLLGMLNLHHTARVFLAVQVDRRVPLWLKISAWSGMVYVFSPLDILPDLFTGIGLLDDIIFSLIIMQAFLEFAPRDVVEEHCARLNVSFDQVFISVPRTIREARSLYVFMSEFGSSFKEGFVASSSDEDDDEHEGQPAGRNGNPAEKERIEPARSRYSSYRASDADQGKEQH
jgi:uncharacterized membrane protein YkvA (DUF1232 family)